jgi:pimeloyl-ACP methyl ester carboxylesterase
MAVPPLKIHIDAGSGPVIVILPGFGMTPEVYGKLARLVAQRCRVIVPTLYGVRGPWRYTDMVERLGATLDAAGVEEATLMAHSFAGGILLGFASQHPERVLDAVFVDTLAVAHDFTLVREATSHPTHLLRMATPVAARGFLQNALCHPRQLAQAGWWGFRSVRLDEIERVAHAGVRCHVMWANRDSLLSREDGHQFAVDLHASFTVAFSPRGPVDHDWIYRHPHIFLSHLDDLGLAALSPSAVSGSPTAGARPR